MCGGTPWREPQLTRVSKSYRDAICQAGNRWKSWPLLVPKSSQTDRTCWLPPLKGVSGGRAVEDGGVGVKVTCFVKLLLEDHGDSSAPHLHEPRQLCVAAQRVRRRTAIRSRLCNWHQPDVGGYTCLERRGGSWHRRTGLPVLHGEWQEEADLAAAFHVGITACSDIETKNDFVGKFNCEFLSPFMFLLK